MKECRYYGVYCHNEIEDDESMCNICREMIEEYENEKD